MDWEADCWRSQTEHCMHQDPGERSSDPPRDWPRLTRECPEVSSGGEGRQWPAAGLGALSVAVPAWDLLKKVTFIIFYLHQEIPYVAQTVKSLPTMRETQVQSLGREDPLEKEVATHSRILAWKIPWTEDPGRLQSLGSQRVGHDWATWLHFTSTIVWPQKNNREGTQPHPQQKIRLKIY